MSDYDLLSLAEFEAPAASSKPCCKGCAESAALAGGPAELPAIDALNAELEFFTSHGGDSNAELELAGLDPDLLLEEDIGVPDPSAPPPVSLDDLVACAQHYPGLKITLSF